MLRPMAKEHARQKGFVESRVESGVLNNEGRTINDPLRQPSGIVYLAVHVRSGSRNVSAETRETCLPLLVA